MVNLNELTTLLNYYDRMNIGGPRSPDVRGAFDMTSPSSPGQNAMTAASRRRSWAESMLARSQSPGVQNVPENALAAPARPQRMEFDIQQQQRPNFFSEAMPVPSYVSPEMMDESWQGRIRNRSRNPMNALAGMRYVP